MTPRLADLDLAITSGAVSALRKHAASIRRRAAAGITVIDVPFVVIRNQRERTRLPNCERHR